MDIEFENLVNNQTQDASSLDPFSSYSATDENGYPFPEKECSEDDDSDEDYASIQRPAFVVEGEPNFDSGSPEDGLEYLRRVRYNYLVLSIPSPFPQYLIDNANCLQYVGYNMVAFFMVYRPWVKCWFSWVIGCVGLLVVITMTIVGTYFLITEVDPTLL